MISRFKIINKGDYIERNIEALLIRLWWYYTILLIPCLKICLMCLVILINICTTYCFLIQRMSDKLHIFFLDTIWSHLEWLWNWLEWWLHHQRILVQPWEWLILNILVLLIDWPKWLNKFFWSLIHWGLITLSSSHYIIFYSTIWSYFIGLWVRVVQEHL